MIGLAGTLTLAAQAQAACPATGVKEFTGLGAAPTSWADTGNWGGTLPGAGDIVCIDGGASVTFDATAASVAAVRVLDDGTRLTIPSGTLTTGGQESTLGEPGTSGRVVISGGTLAVGNGGALGTILEVNGGALDGPGLVTLAGDEFTGGIVKNGAANSLVSPGILSTYAIETHGTGQLTVEGWTQYGQGGLRGVINLFPGSSQVRLPGPVQDIQAGGNVILNSGTSVVGGAGNTPSTYATITGELRIQSGTHTVAGNITVGDGGDLTMQGGQLNLQNLEVEDQGVVIGDIVSPLPRINASGTIHVAPGGLVGGKLQLSDPLVVEGDLAPRGDIVDPVQIDGDTTFNGVFDSLFVQAQPLLKEAFMATVNGHATIGGWLRLANDGGVEPVAGTYPLLNYDSHSGEFAGIQGAVILNGAGNPAGLAAVPAYGATQAVLNVVPAGPPTVTDLAVAAATGGAAVSVNVDPNNVMTTAELEYGATTAYGSSVPLGPLALNSTPQALAATLGLAPGTYHFRVTADSEYGAPVQSADVQFTVAGPPAPPVTPPTTPTTPTTPVTPVVPQAPVTPQAPPALKPISAASPRTLTAKRLKNGSLQIKVRYRAGRDCKNPCRATVQLRLRSGKQLYALPGDGKLIASRKNVRIKTGRQNTITLTISKKVAGKIAWAKAGKFRTAKVRLLVTLPQADGRKLDTVRDGTLRVAAPKKAVAKKKGAR